MSVSGQTQRGIILAAGTAVAQVNGAATSSAWTELIASTSTAILITSVFAYTNSTYMAVTMSIGTGSAGSEVTVYSAAAGVPAANAFATVVYSLPYPIRVAASTRVAVTTSGAFALNVGFTYVRESAVL